MHLLPRPQSFFPQEAGSASWPESPSLLVTSKLLDSSAGDSPTPTFRTLLVPGSNHPRAAGREAPSSVRCSQKPPGFILLSLKTLKLVPPIHGEGQLLLHVLCGGLHLTTARPSSLSSRKHCFGNCLISFIPPHPLSLEVTRVSIPPQRGEESRKKDEVESRVQGMSWKTVEESSGKNLGAACREEPSRQQLQAGGSYKLSKAVISLKGKRV